MVERKHLVSGIVGAMVAMAAVGGVHAATAPAPKAYVVAEFTVTDPATYKSYAPQAAAIVARHGGVYIARGGRTVSVEGAPPADRVVLIEFPSLAAAQAFEASPEYRAIAPIRQRASKGRVFLVEGAQP